MDTIFTLLENLQPRPLDAGQTFSGKPSGVTVQGYSTPSAYTPDLDPSFILHEGCRDIIVWLINPTDPLYVFGPTGCAKTSSIKQLAAGVSYLSLKSQAMPDLNLLILQAT